MIATFELNVRRRGGKARGFILRTPFSRSFLERLKAAVPASDRDWLEDREGWWIAAMHRRAAEALVLQYWPELQRTGTGDEDEIVTRGGIVATQGRLAL